MVSIYQLELENLPEPFVGCANETGEMALNVFNIVKLGREGVAYINDDDFPVSLAFIEKCHNAKDLHLLDLTDVAHLLSDLADIERIVISLRLGFGV